MTNDRKSPAPMTTMEAMDAAGRELRYLGREFARTFGVYKALDLLQAFLRRFTR